MLQDEVCHKVKFKCNYTKTLNNIIKGQSNFDRRCGKDKVLEGIEREKLNPGKFWFLTVKDEKCS